MLNILSVISLALLVSGSPTGTKRQMAVHEQRTAPPGFARVGKPKAAATLDLRIALVPQDIAGLEKALYDVSTPGNALYGQHLSLDEVKAFAAPSSESISVVTNWLTTSGVPAELITTTGPFDDWLSFTIPIDTADSLFDTSFESFVHEASGEQMIRTLEYSIPVDLQSHIDLVHPTTTFVKKIRSTPQISFPAPLPPTNETLEERALGAPSSCNSVVTPSCLESLYGIPATRATQSSNKLGVSGFIEQFANTADLRTFLANLRPDLPSTTTFTLQTLDGGQNPQGANQAGIEANLDIQYTVGVASGVPVTFVSVGENNADGVDGFLDIINFLNGQSAPPQVLTTSYGFDERDLGSTLANRLCNAYMTLGARGVSILFASGDGGVSGGQSQSCTTFVPAFPGGCPFHTAVGSVEGVTETSSSFSSGGFSNVFARPSYQASAVSSYLSAIGSLNSGRFNANGRGFPDVAAQGNNIEIVVGGRAGLVAGTSASSPIFASVIALINDRLVAAGRPVLGFLNPFLYANPGAFFDITTGSNPGCGTNGFPARAGWDPVTGLGSPNFAALLSAAGL
ncbi:protease s8 tripeptidyl peptidase [Moniliophthora roreri MCA 2997]|uniref:tripeptidyl-peptidase II n=1 Tax=Moniliophthora roreri (strain MCA 2997) TaxID=1381753 RepID=V2YX85_MONRO|nr:protease s8 tripeptidyl peptidase [Moniliophthora roreri MCA 2997]KAI3608483.1 protease s8 tripeptidyl peptidase [Moniliophthora roreri]